MTGSIDTTISVRKTFTKQHQYLTVQTRTTSCHHLSITNSYTLAHNQTLPPSTPRIQKLTETTQGAHPSASVLEPPRHVVLRHGVLPRPGHQGSHLVRKRLKRKQPPRRFTLPRTQNLTIFVWRQRGAHDSCDALTAVTAADQSALPTAAWATEGVR